MSYLSSLITVIVPCYNYSHFLSLALDSVLAQDLCDLEIILVDDGSTDDTANLASKYKDNLKYIYQDNAGLSAARNTGIAHSRGEFILFLDADDILGPRCLKSQLEYFERNPDRKVVVCRNKIFEETDSKGRPKSVGSWKLYRSNLDIHLCHFNVAPPHAFLFRREAIMQTGWFDPQLKACEDYDFWLRAAVRGFVPHYNSEGLVYYRRHPGSMSADLLNQHFHDAFLHKRLSDLLDEYPGFPHGRRLEGLMAFSAGALLTAARLYSHQLDGVDVVLEMARKRIEEAKQLAYAEKYDWNMLIVLFFIRIWTNLANPGFRNSSLAKEMQRNLEEIIAAMKVPESKIGLLVDAFVSKLRKRPGFFLKRQELMRQVFMYLKDSRVTKLLTR